LILNLITHCKIKKNIEIGNNLKNVKLYKRKTLKNRVDEFLEQRKIDIEKHKFFPSAENVIKELDSFGLEGLNNNTVGIYIRDWIRENKILNADGFIDLKKEFGKSLYEGSSRINSSTIRLNEEHIKKKLRGLDLELLSDYSIDYRNKDSILKLKCNNCGYEFEDTLNKLERRIFSCPKEYEEGYKKRKYSERKKKSFDIEKIKKRIREIDFGKLTYRFRKNQNSPSIEIELDPYSDCSHANPLYRNKVWLERIYLDKDLNLSDKKLAKICQIDDSNITRWRKRHGIPTKERKSVGKWLEKKSGRVRMYMPHDYLHPQQKHYANGERKNTRFEHDYLMEQYLVKHPKLIREKFGVLRDNCLLRGTDGKLYLNNECPVHHINYIKNDNRLKNFWLCESKKAHDCKIEVSFFKCLSKLIKLGQIVFRNGNYFFREDFNYKVLNERERNILLNRKQTLEDYRYIMENYLRENPELEKSKKYLDSNRKLKSACRIHHINLDHEDNRLSNLWICENASEHHLIHGSLTKFAKILLEYKFIIFKNGMYHLG